MTLRHQRRCNIPCSPCTQFQNSSNPCAPLLARALSTQPPVIPSGGGPPSQLPSSFSSSSSIPPPLAAKLHGLRPWDVGDWCNSCRRSSDFSPTFADDFEYPSARATGTRWRGWWRRMIKQKRRILNLAAPMHVAYDPYSYAQNFEGIHIVYFMSAAYGSTSSWNSGNSSSVLSYNLGGSCFSVANTGLPPEAEIRSPLRSLRIGGR